MRQVPASCVILFPGTYTICKIMAAIELGKRRQLATMGLRPDMSSATSIYNYMRKKACDLMRIHLLDHVIVCDGDYYSYHDRGRL